MKKAWSLREVEQLGDKIALMLIGSILTAAWIYFLAMLTGWVVGYDAKQFRALLHPTVSSEGIEFPDLGAEENVLKKRQQEGR